VIHPASKCGCRLPTICPYKIFGKDKGVLEDKKAKLSFEYEHKRNIADETGSSHRSVFHQNQELIT
jgi:hypothetical protein